MKIKSITKGIKKHTYDVEIKNKHHYLMANGIVSHNTSTSLLMGVTASYLPTYSKFFIDKASNGSIIIVPPFLNKETFLYYQENKNIDQNIIVETTKNMQQWIDQGLSMEFVIDLNNPDFNPKYLYDLYMNAWKSGCKTIYYLRTEAKKMNNNAADCVMCAN